jgi:hypothetical protein
MVAFLLLAKLKSIFVYTTVLCKAFLICNFCVSWYSLLIQSGLFFYDIFWVFFTPVMVSVAKSFDAPIKVSIP